MAETYKYGLRDLDGRCVPDSKLSMVGRDVIESSADYNASIQNDVHAYFYDNEKSPVLLKDIDTDKYIVKFIAGLWRVRERPKKSYTITNVYDKQFVLGSEIIVSERDDFNFRYYYAGLVRYDLFDVLTPEFNWYVAKCYTRHGRMMRYGQTREAARAFLRGAIMDGFAPNIAEIVLNNKKKQKE